MSILLLLSGGASALETWPIISLADWQALNQALPSAGCPIQELDVERRRLDRIKGGSLAKLIAPANCVCMVLSDVVGNHLPAIGSGPAVPNPDPPGSAWRLFERYEIREKVPSATWRSIIEALDQPDIDDGLPIDPIPHIIIGDIRRAAEATLTQAKVLGFNGELVTVTLQGEAREAGRAIAALTDELAEDSCLVLGGETAVTVKGSGAGGRNTELALSAAIYMVGQCRCCLAFFATDGEDGTTPAAGALITEDTIKRAIALGIDPEAHLDDNDSYRFFEQVGGLIKTGPNGTNVNGLVTILKYRREDDYKIRN